MRAFVGGAVALVALICYRHFAVGGAQSYVSSPEICEAADLGSPGKNLREPAEYNNTAPSSRCRRVLATNRVRGINESGGVST